MSLHIKYVTLQHMSSKMGSVKKGAVGLLLMLAGGTIYLLFRPRTLLLFFVADKLGMGSSIDAWRDYVNSQFIVHYSLSFSQHLSSFALYSLPCGLWTLSYLFIMDGLFHSQPPATRLRWASVIPIFSIATELLQGLRLLPGTFDIADLLCYLVPYVLYILIILNSSLLILNSPKEHG